MDTPPKTSTIPSVVERFLRQLVTTYRAVLLYPETSAIPRENSARAVKELGGDGTAHQDLRVSVDKDGLRVDGVRALAGHSGAATLARELYYRSVAEVRFRTDVTAEALLGFLGVLRRSPEEVEASGGFESMLWDTGVDSVTIVETCTVVMDAPPVDREGQEVVWPPDNDRIEELLLTGRDPHSEGHRVLVRVLLDAEALADFVDSVFRRAAGSRAQLEPGDVLADIARIVANLEEEERREALRSIADVTRKLPAGRLRARSAERILAAARTDRAVASYVRQVGIDDMCCMLTEGLEEDDVSVEGLARAIRNLTQISLAARDEVSRAAGVALQEAGISASTTSAVLGAAAPSSIVIAEGDGGPTDANLDSVLRLVELASAAPGEAGDDAGTLALRDEAHRGFRDGDVTGALVTLTVLSLGTSGFEESISSLEAGLGVLLERGEFEVAAVAAETLLEVARTASAEEGLRLTDAVRRLADEREMRALHRAMHVYERDTSEHQACERLLGTLGGIAIDPLLEMLADEPDMTLRKSLVDLISSVARDHIAEVGDRITDARWYFVRNVVSILGSTHHADALPYLDRTVRHADARVRRESIRALAGIADSRSPGLLGPALDDADAGNVQLAARYLGRLKHAASVPALLAVARGEGAGNREYAARAEAIEALGVIGSPEALPELEAIAGPRLLAGQRSRDLAAVASAAIAAIEAAEGGGTR
ncbi:MAG: HEAT repeat domain-containing protein [Anaerosomatales bacterium]|nr:HEAT repeat domain-containing protein [Anaerosomatales bacterium]